MLEQGIDGEDFWDICCDHGYLGEAALASGRFRTVHFVDRVPHIISNLKERLGENEGASFTVSCAEDLPGPLAGVIVIAGVGGHNIVKILERWGSGDDLVAKRIVLNPLTHAETLKGFLLKWPAYVTARTINVQEKARSREILILERRA